MRKIKRIIFFIAVFIYGLSLEDLFAATKEHQEIKKIEETQQPPAAPIIVRPSVEYKAEKLKDPFQGRAEEGEMASDAISVGPPALSIQGLVWGGVLPEAIINNKIVKVGDTIENARIIDINKEGVTIFFNGQQYTLPSPASSTPTKKIEQKPKGGTYGL
jgi:predicted HAD superfamily phosphohydrolase